MNRLGMVAGCWVVILCLASAARAVTPGFVDDFSAPGTAGWSGSTGQSNPGTGGVGGAGDGFLRIANAFTSNFGSMNVGADYTGDWTAAGITDVSFHLNDVDADQNLSFHFLLSSPGGSAGTTWQHNTAFIPPNAQWQQFSVNLSNEADWTRIRGTLSLAQVLQDVGTVHFRHDLAPYFANPDPIQAEIGVDNITLIVPEPSTAAIAAVFGCAALCRRRRRC